MEKNTILALVNILGIIGISIVAIMLKDGGQFASIIFLILLDIALGWALD